MNQPIDLSYDKESFAGSLEEREVAKFEEWLHDSEYAKIFFDPSYINHLAEFHGGIPAKRYFQTSTGTKRGINRFLNFLSSNTTHALGMYSVPVIWSLCSDRMSDFLMPFAELEFGDLLCFDFQQQGRPRVVVWFHELSHSHQSPFTEFVAADFDGFLSKLTDT